MDNISRLCLRSFVFILIGLSHISALKCSSAQVKGFCQTSPCPGGFQKDPRYGGWVGCGNPRQHCCVFDTSTSPDLGEMSRDKCGLGSLVNPPRILNGIPTGVCDWPFVVSIRSLKKDAVTLSYANSMHMCAGVLINRQWVLTSPFCVLSSAGKSLAEVPNNVLVVAGDYNVSKVDMDPITGQQQEQWINVEKAFIEPNYEWTSFFAMAKSLADTKKINSNAVALLKLKEPIGGLCSGVACLPTPLERQNDCASYDRCVVLGWGLSKPLDPNGQNKELTVLNHGPVHLTSRKACNFLEKKMKLEKYRPAGSGCQVQGNRNFDSCAGDEGGPILCASGNHWVVRGLVPFNFCSTTDFNMWTTDVALSLDWIHTTIKRG